MQRNQRSDCQHLLDHCKGKRSWFINIELTANSPKIHAWMKLFSHIYFKCKTHCSLLVLMNTRHHVSTVLRDHFKQEDYQKEAQQWKNKIKTHYKLSRWWKGHLFGVWVLKQVGRVYFDLGWEWAHGGILIFVTLHMSTSDHESTEGVDLGVINII